MKRLLVAILLVLPLIECLAGSTSNVTMTMNCRSKHIAAQEQQWVLNTGNGHKKSKIYLLHNRTNYQLLLDHPMARDPGAKAGWGSLIDANHWSALLLNRRHFNLSCARMRDGKMQKVNCKDALQVCIYTGPIDNAISGSYWFVENQTKKDLFTKMQQRFSDDKSAMH